MKYYIRYCDDFVILGTDRNNLLETAGAIKCFLVDNLELRLHEGKIIIRKFSQGIDFLGYIAFPGYRALRTRTKERLFKKVSRKNLQSYLGVLSHCSGFKIRKKIKEDISYGI